MEVVNSRFEVQQFFYSYQTSSGAYNNTTYTAVASQQHMCVPVFYGSAGMKSHSTCLFNTNWSNSESKSSPSSVLVESYIRLTATDTLLVVLRCSDLCAFPDISEDKRTIQVMHPVSYYVVAIKSWLNMSYNFSYIQFLVWVLNAWSICIWYSQLENLSVRSYNLSVRSYIPCNCPMHVGMFFMRILTREEGLYHKH